MDELLPTPDQEKTTKEQIPDVIFNQKQWMMNELSSSDQDFTRILREMQYKLPVHPTLEQISQAIFDLNIKTLEEMGSGDIEKGEEIQRMNRAPLLKEWIEEKKPVALGRFFDREKPAFVCQQNVLLLNALAAKYGYDVGVAGFEYTGSETLKRRIHAVATFKDKNGDEFVLDPTPLVKKYGSPRYIRRDKYLEMFLDPDISSSREVFSPVKTDADVHNTIQSATTVERT